MSWGEPQRCAICGAPLYIPHSGQGLMCPNGCNYSTSHPSPYNDQIQLINKRLNDYFESNRKINDRLDDLILRVNILEILQERNGESDREHPRSFTE